MACPLWASEVATLEPSIPDHAVNLVKNPGIESGDSDWINGRLGYHAERANNFIFKVDSTQAFAGSNCLYMASKSNKFSGYWAQDIPVEAGKHYLFKARVKSDNANVMILLWGGLPGGKKYEKNISLSCSACEYLIPLYLKPKYTTERGGGWELVYGECVIPEGMSVLSLAMGIYFSGGAVRFDEIGVYQVDVKELPVKLSIAIQDKSVVSVKVYLQRTEGDIIFEHKYTSPVASVNAVIPGTSADRAYAAQITLDDGSERALLCPTKTQQVQ